MADDDLVDTETLQAQIDLSMSLMHGLVSSWIKPTSKPFLKSNDNILENELRESLRRPPRLGVGASIPDANQSNSRDAARLKGQLVGKRKRDADDNLDELPSAQRQGRVTDEDDEESRSAAIKKKTKIDPFCTQVPRQAPSNHINRETNSSVNNGKAEAGAEKSRPAETSSISSESTDSKYKDIPHPSSKLVVLSRSEDQGDRPVSPIRALLNLDGPVAGQSSEDDEIHGVHNQSPSKKKRKRRKKKKSLQNQTTP